MKNTTLIRDNTGVVSISAAAASGAWIALAALASYEITIRALTAISVSRDDQMLGAMWSVVATLFVIRRSSRESIRAASSRTIATLLSFILCLTYLLIFPFNFLGMAALIGIGVVILIMIGRSEHIITNTITTTVVMVVAGLTPQHAWKQPILRLIDTLIGVAVGLAAGSIGMRLSHLKRFDSQTPRKEKSDGK